MTWTSNLLMTPAGVLCPLKISLTRTTGKLGRSSQVVQTSRWLGMNSQ
ncbi:hypothetical protein A6R68_01571 [Neotoma lepida]|uniref:Uncharacterized protein n=1 Tax=Neotoma lepida TaxID=56216 RepID=A0A1A6GU83_NEOLE|nr:hypothetical protein A6R68_01571 [Neotoma lepida]